MKGNMMEDGYTGDPKRRKMDERAILSSFYRNLKGPKLWKNKWDIDNLECKISEWYGIKINSDGKVVGINLSSNNLAGDLRFATSKFH